MEDREIIIRKKFFHSKYHHFKTDYNRLELLRDTLYAANDDKIIADFTMYHRERMTARFFRTAGGLLIISTVIDKFYTGGSLNSFFVVGAISAAISIPFQSNSRKYAARAAGRYNRHVRYKYSE